MEQQRQVVPLPHRQLAFLQQVLERARGPVRRQPDGFATAASAETPFARSELRTDSLALGRIEVDRPALGSEVDVMAAAQITPRLSVVAKYADYDGVPGFADRQKFWLGFEFKL